MPIGAVLLVLDAKLDDAVTDAALRPWAVAEVVSTMLPTTAGLVAMAAQAEPRARGRTRRLVSADELDPDWARVGCVAIPGHHRFFGRSTAYVHLDDARTALAHVREQVVNVIHD
ncbi:MAG: hypothetical protein QOG79_7541 [Mycobacterium sp.]|jgi:hypothetical protein|nr:hypothetical protein [Mycobacterium sp.]